MVLLGSTGSIGTNTLELVRRHGLKIEVLCGGHNTLLLQSQIDEFQPDIVVTMSKEKNIKAKRILYGKDGIIEALNLSKSKLVVNAITGYAGLEPTLEALKLNKKLALANKESLVIAGAFLDTKSIHPIDSEHFGLWYLLQKRPIKRLLLTASGGAFRETSLKNIKHATIQEALNHPNWNMGKKITIDSATMANKLYELLEARWLFGATEIDAIIETKSVIHALVEFIDGSTLAHISGTDMKLPISFAIFDKVEQNILPHVDLEKIGELRFKKIEKKRYPLWELKERLLENPKLGALFNAANESAVELFLSGSIGFGDISKKVFKAFKRFGDTRIESLEDALLLHKEARIFTLA